MPRLGSARHIASNILGLSVLRGTDLLIPIILLPYLVHAIGLPGYGQFSVALAFSLYVGALVQYGFPITASRDIARAAGDPSKVSEIFAATMFAKMLLATAGISIATACILLVPMLQERWELYATATLYTVLRVLFPSWLFQALGEMRSVAIAGIAIRLALVAVIILFVRSPDDVGLLIGIYALSAALTLLIGLCLAKRILGALFPRVSAARIVETIRSGRHAFQSQLAPTLYNSSTMLILGGVAGDAVAGILASGQKIIDLIGSGATILSSSFLPALSRDVGGHARFGRGMILTGLVLTIACVAGAGPASSILFGAQAAVVTPVVKMLAVSLVGMFAFTAYNQNYLMVVGADRLAKRIVTNVSLVLLVVSFIVIPKFGLAGAIAILVIGRSALGLLSYFAAKQIHSIALAEQEGRDN